MTALLQDSNKGSEDNNNNEGLWEPIEGESKQQVEQRKKGP
jgi:hypothetical protein